ncbi:MULTISPECIES: phosphopantetheine-binding protein [unclassified Streptomyces]|jgi:acyl carrier protein|uniref:phosphopantetheine-binding protein n=1 Tax=unclassified Streptomyces TaxID=2593676 RepID=UPI0033BA8F2B
MNPAESSFYTSAWDQKFKEILCRHVEKYEEDPERPIKLVDLGLDSLKTLRLAFDIEETFGITFPDELMTTRTFETDSSLAKAVRELCGA